MADYSIQDLAHLSGVKAHTIRIWEQRYKLIEPKRSTTNIRTYNDLELKKLLNISLLLNFGHKISKIACLSENELVAQIESLGLLKSESFNNESNISGLVSAMIDLDENKFDKIFTASLLRMGFEKTITDIIYPFLERVGLLWGINKINPLQEHFISNLIRNKIIISAENQSFSVTKKAKFIVFLPSNEYHELGVLLANYILKINGYKVIYLGQNVPVEYIEEALMKFDNCYLLSHITFLLEDATTKKLSKLIKNKYYKEFFLSGNEGSCKSFVKSKLVKYCNSIEVFKKDLSKIK